MGALLLRAGLGFAGAAWLLACAAFSSYALAAALLPRADLLTRAAAALAAMLWLAQVAFHLLASAGQFNLPAALLATTAAAACAHLIARRRGLLSAPWAHDRRALALLRRRAAAAPGRLGFLFAVIACAAVGRCLVMPVLGWDTLVYHAFKPAVWVQTGTYEAWNPPGGWSVFRLHPASAEVLTAWGMLPFHSDLLAGVDGFVWLALGLAVLHLGRQLGLRGARAGTAAVFVLALPTARLLVGSGYVELTQSLALVLALAFGVRYLRKALPGDLLVSFAMLGVLAGTKITMIAVAGPLGAVLACKALIAGRGRAPGLVLAAACAAALPYLPWLVRNTQLTGYPLSPVPLRAFGLTLGRGNETVEALQSMVAGQPAWDWAREGRFVKALFALPGRANYVGFGALAAAPVLLAPAGGAALARRRPLAVLLFATAGAAFLGLYFNRQVLHVRTNWTTNSARFLLGFVCAAVPLSLAWCRRDDPWSAAYLRVLQIAAAFNLVFYAVAGWSVHDAQGVLALAGLVAAGWGLVSLAGREAGPRAAAAAALASALIVVLGLAVIKRRTRYDALRDSEVFDGTNRYWLPAARALDRPRAAHRIAVASGPQTGGDWFAHHFLGASFQNRVDYVSPARDGRPVQRAYGERDGASASFDDWHARLRSGGFTHVMSFRPPGVELRWLEQKPELFRRVEGEAGVWGLYEVAKGEPPAP